MGNAASLFYSTANPESCLDYRIRPSDEQEAAQQARWNHLAEFLLGRLSEVSGYAVSSWLQGSYKFGTQVRPPSAFEEFDIDLGVYYRWPGHPDDGRFDPTELKSFVLESLEAYAEDDGNEAEHVAHPKERCCRIHFKDGFHIDVPAYHLDAAEDARSLATQTSGWESSDPKAIYIWWKEHFDESLRPRARRLVRYLKMWAMLHFKEKGRPSSILLTVLVANALDEVDLGTLTGDDEFLHAVAEEALNALRRSGRVENPVSADENLNRLDLDQQTAFVSALEALVSTAANALAAPTRTESAEIWAELFGHFMPLPDQAEEPITKAMALVPVQFDPQVFIEAKSGAQVIRGTNGIGPIPRGCDLIFTLVNAAQLPVGADVTWTVRNMGDAAEAHNDLGHMSRGVSTQETSAYRGTHYMDINVRLRGVSIGRRRVPVQVSGFGFPRRNPPRPVYTRLR